jgi:hypothetical protein
MKVYTLREVYKLTGITENELNHLTRRKGKRQPLFKPAYPASGSGYENLYSDTDVKKLRTYVGLKKKLRDTLS